MRMDHILYETRRNKQHYYGYIRDGILKRGVTKLAFYYTIPHDIFAEALANGAHTIQLFDSNKEEYFYESQVAWWQKRQNGYYLSRKRMIKLRYGHATRMRKAWYKIPEYERYLY